jgi:tetratricopeptide (TPR) repeat protein
MGLREWGLAAIIAISSSSCTTTQTKPSPVVDNYTIALDMKRKAEQEPDSITRNIQYEQVLKQFQKSREYGIRPLDSLLQEADIHSLLGDPVTALDLADKVIKEDTESPVGFYVKGQIEQRHGYFAYAIRSFTTSIEKAKARLSNSDDETLKSNIAEALWNRYNCHVALSIRLHPETKILAGPVEKAIKDMDEYIQLRKDEPDGYLAKGAAQCIMEKAKNDEPHNKEAYLTIKRGIELFKKGKQFRQKPFSLNPEGLLKEFEELKKIYEPEEKKEY